MLRLMLGRLLVFKETALRHWMGHRDGDGESETFPGRVDHKP